MLRPKVHQTISDRDQHALGRPKGLDSHPVLHVIVPQSHVDEIPQQPGTNDLELSSQDPSSVNVARVRLETLVPAQDL